MWKPPLMRPCLMALVLVAACATDAARWRDAGREDDASHAEEDASRDEEDAAADEEDADVETGGSDDAGQPNDAGRDASRACEAGGPIQPVFEFPDAGGDGGPLLITGTTDASEPIALTEAPRTFRHGYLERANTINPWYLDVVVLAPALGDHLNLEHVRQRWISDPFAKSPGPQSSDLPHVVNQRWYADGSCEKLGLEWSVAPAGEADAVAILISSYVRPGLNNAITRQLLLIAPPEIRRIGSDILGLASRYFTTPGGASFPYSHSGEIVYLDRDDHHGYRDFLREPIPYLDMLPARPLPAGVAARQLRFSLSKP